MVLERDRRALPADADADEIVLREKDKGLARAFEILANLPDDCLLEGRRVVHHRSGDKSQAKTS